MLDYSKKKEVSRIRSYLYEVAYDIYYQKVSGIYNYYFNPWQKYDVILSNLEGFNKDIKILFKLLLLGNKFEKKLVNKYLNKEFIEDLIRVNFLIENDEFIQSDSYSIVPYHDRYLVASIPYDYPNCCGSQEIYLGLDSYKLIDILPHRKIENRLDLCTGTGIQCIMNADTFKHCIAVEKNDNVIPALKFNIALNQLEDKIDVINGNLFDEVQLKKFDLITANPPFIPVPKDLLFPLAGAGGDDGLEIINEILLGITDHLNTKGEAIIIGEAIGNENGTVLYQKILKLFPSHFEGELFLQNKCSKDEYIKRMSLFYTSKLNQKSNLKEVKEKWNQIFVDNNTNFVYSFLLRLRKTEINKSKFQEIKNFKEESEIIKPRITGEYKCHSMDPNYYLVINNNIIGTINDELKKCLILCNGNKTVDQIIEEVMGEQENTDYIKNAFLAICNEMISKNVMINKGESK